MVPPLQRRKSDPSSSRLFRLLGQSFSGATCSTLPFFPCSRSHSSQPFGPHRRHHAFGPGPRSEPFHTPYPDRPRLDWTTQDTLDGTRRDRKKTCPRHPSTLVRLRLRYSLYPPCSCWHARSRAADIHTPLVSRSYASHHQPHAINRHHPPVLRWLLPTHTDSLDTCLLACPCISYLHRAQSIILLLKYLAACSKINLTGATDPPCFPRLGSTGPYLDPLVSSVHLPLRFVSTLLLLHTGP